MGSVWKLENCAPAAKNFADLATRFAGNNFAAASKEVHQKTSTESTERLKG